MISPEILDTWRDSIIEIKVKSDWKVIWDGKNVNLDSIAESVANWDLYVLTAYNPGSVNLSDKENRHRNTALNSKIDGLSIKYYESVGRSLSGSHCEFGFAIYGVDRVLIDRLANEFGQIGYYKFSVDSMTIYAVTSKGIFVAI